jgi:hypothetical protein
LYVSAETKPEKKFNGTVNSIFARTAAATIHVVRVVTASPTRVRLK